MVNLFWGKRGWLRIVEATIALVIVFGFVIYISSGSPPSKGHSNQNQHAELVLPILNSIAENNTLRNKIASAENSGDYEALNVEIEKIFLPLSQIEGFELIVNISEIDKKIYLNSQEVKSSKDKDIEVFERIIVPDSGVDKFKLKKLTLFVW